jgi:hypothetical protein
MNDTPPDLWATDRIWHIVRADVDLTHAFAPNSGFVFEQGTNSAGIKGYRIVHRVQCPHPRCFGDTFLRPAGNTQPTFAAAKVPPLPAFNADSAQQYADVSAAIAAHMDENPDVQHLEGTIKVPLHAADATPGAETLDDPSQWMEATVRIYQFTDGVVGNSPLLLVSNPPSPASAANGGGTAIGLS